MPQFTAADLTTVDRDYEVSYWPGGFGFDSILPVQIDSGAIVDIGTVRLRKVPYYRVRVSIPPGDCSPGETIEVAQSMAGNEPGGGKLGEVPCGKDVLLRGFPQGAYWLELIPRGRNRDSLVRGIVQFNITDRNLDLTVPLVRGVDIQGQIITKDLATQPNLDGLHMSLLPVKGSVSSNDEVADPKLDPEAKFTIPNIRLGQHRLRITGVPAGYYIKQVRLAGIALPAGTAQGRYIVQVAGSGPLEIVLGDRAPKLTGSVTDADHPASNAMVCLVKWPFFPDDLFMSVTYSQADKDGKFHFDDLAPGDYRVLAVRSDDGPMLEAPNVLQRLLSRAEKTTLDLGGSTDLSLSAIDPRR